jgi:hypothetical protein
MRSPDVRTGHRFKHGMLELRTQLVLSGCNIHYLPPPRFRPRQPGVGDRFLISKSSLTLWL